MFYAFPQQIKEDQTEEPKAALLGTCHLSALLEQVSKG